MFSVHPWRSLAFMLALLAVGCGKGGVAGALGKAKTAVTKGAASAQKAVQQTMNATSEQVQEQLNLAGSFELTAGQPLKTAACYVRVIPQGTGRPIVLQLQSYRDSDRESFPSVFLQAQVQANSLAELVGEPLSARMFVQREADGPVLFSDVSTPIEFKITSADEQTVSVELTKAVLRDTSTGAEIPVTGSITGVVE